MVSVLAPYQSLPPLLGASSNRNPNKHATVNCEISPSRLSDPLSTGQSNSPQTQLLLSLVSLRISKTLPLPPTYHPPTVSLPTTHHNIPCPSTPKLDLVLTHYFPLPTWSSLLRLTSRRYSKSSYTCSLDESSGVKRPSWPLFSPPAPHFPNQPCRCKLRGTHQAGPEPRVSFPTSVASGQDQDILRPAPQANNIATLLQSPSIAFASAWSRCSVSVQNKRYKHQLPLTDIEHWSSKNPAKSFRGHLGAV